MNPSEITPATLLSIVRDTIRRRALLGAIVAESGSPPPLSNAAAEAAENCVASSDELAEMVELLLPEDVWDDVLDWLVFHPDLPERCLYRLLDAGRCINHLGHRRGPEELLLRLTKEHPEVQETILTLVLVHYGPDPERGDRFLEFVGEHLHVAWLRESLRVSDLAMRLPAVRRNAALALVERYERDS